MIISYINLGNLLSEQGKEIMEKLSDKQNLKLMDIPFIKYLVMYQWNEVKGEIETRLLRPFLALLVLFSLYSVYFITYVDPENMPPTTEGDADDTVGPVGLVIGLVFYWINFVLLLSVLFYFFY